MSRLGKGLLLSLLVHAALFGAGRGWVEWQRRRAFDGLDIDLSRSSLLPLPPSLAGRSAPRPPEDWFVGDARRLAARPLPASPTAEVSEEGSAGPPCPPPCPSNAGDWAPANRAVRVPRWMSGQIGEGDYPANAKRRNQEGNVVVDVLIDIDGKVRGVTIIQASFPDLTEKTIEKLSMSQFSPCVAPDGRPFPCRLRIPVAWSLE